MVTELQQVGNKIKQNSSADGAELLNTFTQAASG
jgi:hypothetical protein